ncbi:hypothetical protein GCM10010279_66260 [Streptomyces mutabilis]|nr:hypothetical protein GCM10010279_66260 [Streptomyces mutabilis]
MLRGPSAFFGYALLRRTLCAFSGYAWGDLYPRANSSVAHEVFGRTVPKSQGAPDVRRRTSGTEGRYPGLAPPPAPGPAPCTRARTLRPAPESRAPARDRCPGTRRPATRARVGARSGTGE